MKTLALAALAATIGFAYPAQASNCGPTTDVLKQLREKYGEVPAFTASLDGGAVMTITVSPKGTWTAISQHSADVACIVASGVDWAIAPPSLANPPAVQPQSAPALLPHGLLLL